MIGLSSANERIRPLATVRMNDARAAIARTYFAGGLYLVDADAEHLALDPGNGRLAWRRGRAKRAGRHCSLPREIGLDWYYRALQLDSRGLLIDLVPLRDGGVCVDAIRIADGDSIWTTDIALPPPCKRTTRTKMPNLPPELLYAFFAQRTDRVAVVLNRMSPFHEMFSGVHDYQPNPEFDTQLEIYELDIQTGRVVRHTEHPGLFIQAQEAPGFDGLIGCGNVLWEFDWETGEKNVLWRFAGPIRGIVATDSKLHVLWANHFDLELMTLDRHGDGARGSQRVEIGRPQSAALYRRPGVVVLRVNSARVVPLIGSGDGNKWLHVAMEPNDFARVADGALFVSCAGLDDDATIHAFDGTNWNELSRSALRGPVTLFSNEKDRTVLALGEKQMMSFTSDGRLIEAVESPRNHAVRHVHESGILFERTERPRDERHFSFLPL